VDGYTVLAEIVRRAGGTYLPVLVMTADTTSAASHRALSEGARDFLTKPFDFTDLVLRVGNLLETRSLYQELRRVSGSLASELGQLRQRETDHKAAYQATADAIEHLLSHGGMNMVFQPVIDTLTGTVLGFEALARFSVEPQRGPDQWFADASAVGLGPALELAAVTRALDALAELPADVFLAVNVSAETVLAGDLIGLATPDIAPRLVFELTEHNPIEDYDPVLRALAPLRARGARLAVDDTGAGYASLRHILALSPDIIKLDLSLVRDIHHDAARRALAAALTSFATDTGTHLIAEGVETEEQLATLTSLGIRWAQGYHLGRPAALPSGQSRAGVPTEIS
jgi:EAL domain-containing protein (putative c-di-GMP-specific phosphodiesterase class I)